MEKKMDHSQASDMPATPPVSDSDRAELREDLKSIEKLLKETQGDEAFKELREQAEGIRKKWADQLEKITTLTDLEYAKSQVKNGVQMLERWKEAIEKDQAAGK